MTRRPTRLSRMSRQGAARTYHSYMSWGYFQRRMAQHRASPAAVTTSPPAAAPSPTSTSGRGGARSSDEAAARRGGASGSGGAAGEAEGGLVGGEGLETNGAAGGSGGWRGSGGAGAPDQAVDSQRSYAGRSPSPLRHLFIGSLPFSCMPEVC